MAFTPTAEQQAVIDTLPTADRLKVTAGAGAGKTATLVQCAQAMPGKKVLYTAFNRAIVEDGKRKFGPNTSAHTSHKLAYDAVARPYRNRLNDNTRMPGYQRAKLLGITEPFKAGDVYFKPGTLARLVNDGVSNFCNGSDEQIDWFHLPKLDGLPDDVQRDLRKYLVRYAQRQWEDLLIPDSKGTGRFPFDPNVFRKIWQLSHPRIPHDVILLDEAQDTAEVFMDVIRRQTHAQTVMIGDTAQAINEWAGAVDSIQKFDAPELRMTQSFRFGQEVADEGNKWLSLLGTDMRITGTGSSYVGTVHDPTAVLCRTNGEVVRQLMVAQKAGMKTALAGQKAKQEIEQLCNAADGLKRGEGTWVKAFMAFTYWSELQEYAQNEAPDLRPFVNVVDEYGTSRIRGALGNLARIDRAELVVSTAHVSKGLEFDRVKIGHDFEEPFDKEGNELDPTPQDVKLAYVAVTRAKRALDPGGLNWINRREERKKERS